MFIRKAALEASELWSEALEMVECLDDRIIDWRWLTNRDEEEPPFISECVLID
jgi:hypothetical protein